MHVSCSSFDEVTENLSEAGTTNTVPSSLVKNRFLPSDTGEEVKPSGAVVRRSLYLISPVLASKQVKIPMSKHAKRKPPANMGVCI